MPLRTRFNRDVLWNVGSLAILGASGIVINGVIARFTGFDALGVFNQVFAVYIFLSQLSVGGIHFSVLKHVSHSQDDPASVRAIVSAALILALGLSTVFGAVAFVTAGAFGSVLDSPDVAFGLKLIAPGLVFFALNKVLLNVLNGVRHMRAFAIFQSLRYVFILVAIAAMIIGGLEGKWLAGALTAAEALLFVLLAIDCLVRILRPTLRGLGPWMREHVSFGTRGLLSGVLGEINTRVDVLMLGYFFDDAAVGVYSFAAIVAEGVSQVPMVVRRNIDPIIGRCFAEGDTARIPVLASKVRRVLVPGMIGVAAVAAAVYPFAFRIGVGEDHLRESWILFGVLLVGIVVNSGWRPVLGILLQGGRPATHTALIALLVVANIVLNVLLIPLLGLLGAAIATSVVYALEAVLIAGFARRCFGLAV